MIIDKSIKTCSRVESCSSGVILIQNSITSLSKIGKLGMRQVPSTNNISRISMTGHMAGNAIRNKHDLGFSESGTGENPKYRISLN